MSICYPDVTLSLHKRKDRPTSNLATMYVYVCEILQFKHKYPFIFIHIPLMAASLHQHPPTFESEPAAITVPEGRLDCRSIKKMLGIADVLSPLDVESLPNENIKRTL